MDWKLFKEVLPEDGQKITVLNPIDESEMQRTFYLDFWKKK